MKIMKFNENEMEKNRKLNVLVAKLAHEKYFVVDHNQTFDRLTRVQQKVIAKKLLEMDELLRGSI